MSKKIVIPGELLSEDRKRLGSNVFVSNGKIYSKVLGMTEEDKESVSVVPLEGKYVPKVDDTVVGVVKREVSAGFEIDINSFCTSFIPRKAVRDQLKLGDLVMARISEVSELREADLEYPKRLFGGEVIGITPVRSPRLIGKNGSMLELLKKGTGSEVVVGKNGRVWARNGDTELLRKVVLFIENNSYKTNLTNTIEEFFAE